MAKSMDTEAVEAAVQVITSTIDEATQKKSDLDNAISEAQAEWTGKVSDAFCEKSGMISDELQKSIDALEGLNENLAAAIGIELESREARQQAVSGIEL